jgi:hypothetical protein
MNMMYAISVMKFTDILYICSSSTSIVFVTVSFHVSDLYSKNQFYDTTIVMAVIALYPHITSTKYIMYSLTVRARGGAS